METRAFESLKDYNQVLEDLVRDGIQSGDFSEGTNIRIFRNMFWGGFTYLGLRWLFVGKGADIDKFSEVNAFINLLLDSIQVKNDIN